MKTTASIQTAVINNVRSTIRKSTRNKKTGYLQVGLGYKENKKMLSIHRLVAVAYVPNPDPTNFDVVNHIDGDKLNNNAPNLEWTNKSGNEKHANKMGIKINALRKLTEDQVRAIRIMDGKESRTSIAIQFGIAPATLRYLLNGKTYTLVK